VTDPALLDPSAAPATQTGPLADLILVRLLTEKRSLGEKRLRADVGPFFRRPPSDDQFAAVRDGLGAAGLALVGTRGGLTLTDAGRARALEYLGVTELPARSNWGTIKAKFLVPKALGVSAGTVDTADKLAAVLLKRKLRLPVGTPATLAGVFNAIACREAGFPDVVVSDLRGLRPYLLGKAIKSPDQVDAEDVEKVAPRVLLDAPAKRSRTDALRAVALLGLTGDEQEPTRPSAGEAGAFDLEAFANTVTSAARKSPTGWFGGNKVFISHVWRQLAAEPPFARLGPDGFRRKLVEANRERLLTLSRADLVQVMDPADVRESETTHLNAVYHFVLVERE
jgi:hypothetical protein